MIVTYSHRAIKALRNLDGAMIKRIRAGIDAIPSGDIMKLKGYSISYRLRIGEYRVIFDMDEQDVKVRDVLPRGSAYKQRREKKT